MLPPRVDLVVLLLDVAVMGDVSSICAWRRRLRCARAVTEETFRVVVISCATTSSGAKVTVVVFFFLPRRPFSIGDVLVLPVLLAREELLLLLGLPSTTELLLVLFPRRLPAFGYTDKKSNTNTMGMEGTNFMNHTLKKIK